MTILLMPFIRLKAYQELKEKFADKPKAFLNYLLRENSQAEINIKPLRQKLLKALREVDYQGDKNHSLNLFAIIDLGNEFFIYSLGDSSLIPVLHESDKKNTKFFLDKLIKRQSRQGQEISRLNFLE